MLSKILPFGIHICIFQLDQRIIFNCCSSGTGYLPSIYNSVICDKTAAFQLYLGGVMLPGMVSGWISDKVGYVQFFWLVMAFCLVTFAVTALVHLPEEERR